MATALEQCDRDPAGATKGRASRRHTASHLRENARVTVTRQRGRNSYGLGWCSAPRGAVHGGANLGGRRRDVAAALRAAAGRAYAAHGQRTSPMRCVEEPVAFGDVRIDSDTPQPALRRIPSGDWNSTDRILCGAAFRAGSDSHRDWPHPPAARRFWASGLECKAFLLGLRSRRCPRTSRFATWIVVNRQGSDRAGVDIASGSCTSRAAGRRGTT